LRGPYRGTSTLGHKSQDVWRLEQRLITLYHGQIRTSMMGVVLAAMIAAMCLMSVAFHVHVSRITFLCGIFSHLISLT
jgi:hypothetical protein